MKELDCVELLADFPGARRGSLGTIVHDYGNAAQVFEVEFVDSDGKTTALLVLTAEQLRRLDYG